MAGFDVHDRQYNTAAGSVLIQLKQKIQEIAPAYFEGQVLKQVEIPHDYRTIFQLPLEVRTLPLLTINGLFLIRSLWLDMASEEHAVVFEMFRKIGEKLKPTPEGFEWLDKLQLPTGEQVAIPVYEALAYVCFALQEEMPGFSERCRWDSKKITKNRARLKQALLEDIDFSQCGTRFRNELLFVLSEVEYPGIIIFRNFRDFLSIKTDEFLAKERADRWALNPVFAAKRLFDYFSESHAGRVEDFFSIWFGEGRVPESSGAMRGAGGGGSGTLLSLREEERFLNVGIPGARGVKRGRSTEEASFERIEDRETPSPQCDFVMRYRRFIKQSLLDFGYLKADLTALDPQIVIDLATLDPFIGGIQGIDSQLLSSEDRKSLALKAFRLKSQFPQLSPDEAKTLAIEEYESKLYAERINEYLSSRRLELPKNHFFKDFYSFINYAPQDRLRPSLQGAYESYWTSSLEALIVILPEWQRVYLTQEKPLGEGDKKLLPIPLLESHWRTLYPESIQTEMIEKLQLLRRLLIRHETAGSWREILPLLSSEDSSFVLTVLREVNTRNLEQLTSTYLRFLQAKAQLEKLLAKGHGHFCRVPEKETIDLFLSKASEIERLETLEALKKAFADEGFLGSIERFNAAYASGDYRFIEDFFASFYSADHLLDQYRLWGRYFSLDFSTEVDFFGDLLRRRTASAEIIVGPYHVNRVFLAAITTPESEKSPELKMATDWCISLMQENSIGLTKAFKESSYPPKFFAFLAKNPANFIRQSPTFCRIAIDFLGSEDEQLDALKVWNTLIYYHLQPAIVDCWIVDFFIDGFVSGNPVIQKETLWALIPHFCDGSNIRILESHPSFPEILNRLLTFLDSGTLSEQAQVSRVLKIFTNFSAVVRTKIANQERFLEVLFDRVESSPEVFSENIGWSLLTLVMDSAFRGHACMGKILTKMLFLLTSESVIKKMMAIKVLAYLKSTSMAEAFPLEFFVNQLKACLSQSSQNLKGTAFCAIQLLIDVNDDLAPFIVNHEFFSIILANLRDNLVVRILMRQMLSSASVVEALGGIHAIATALVAFAYPHKGLAHYNFLRGRISDPLEAIMSKIRRSDNLEEKKVLAWVLGFFIPVMSPSLCFDLNRSGFEVLFMDPFDGHDERPTLIFKKVCEIFHQKVAAERERMTPQGAHILAPVSKVEGAEGDSSFDRP